jgi:arylsulfatase A-like enzyme
LAHLRQADHLIVLSDHGMERSHERGLSGVHRSMATATGVMILHGPRVEPRPQRLLGSALDVAPTVLDLLGIPPAENMPGNVLSSAFRLDRPPLPRRREGYERRLDEEGPWPAYDERPLIDRLRALGYVQ